MKLKSTIELYAVAGGDSYLVHPPGLVTDTPKVRDIARKRLVKTNPDVDAGGPGSGRHKEKYVYKEQTEEEFRKQITDEATKVYERWKSKGGYSSGSKPKSDQSGRVPKKVKWAIEVLQKYGSSIKAGTFKVVDTKDRNVISEHDTEEEAKKAALARPYAKVVRHVEKHRSIEDRWNR